MGSSVVIVTALGAASRDWPDVGLVEMSELALAPGAAIKLITIATALITFFIEPSTAVNTLLIRAYRLTSLDYGTSVLRLCES